jgi:tRNA pseudouridine32 synthase / 23S rRNA pseudouridine746 synthase
MQIGKLLSLAKGRIEGEDTVMATLGNPPAKLDLAKRVLYRDDDMIILDKPPGIAVHKGAGYGDNLEAHFDSLRFGRPEVPALAHRLDKDTSGCLVLGRHVSALRQLGAMFKEGHISKTYWAVVLGKPPQAEGLIDAPLARRSHDKRSWWMKVDAITGDPSKTRYRVLGQADGVAWLELSPLTGRTHQLRVHCEHLGCPIAGDPIYGGDRARAGARHLQLHARTIAVPTRKGIVEVTAAPPAHMEDLLQLCGWHP